MSNPDLSIRSQIFEQYQISDVDAVANPKYTGYLALDGTWYIMQNTSDTTFRYARGSSGYAAAWTGRAGLTYKYVNLLFAS